MHLLGIWKEENHRVYDWIEGQKRREMPFGLTVKNRKESGSFHD